MFHRKFTFCFAQRFLVIATAIILSIFPSLVPLAAHAASQCSLSIAFQATSGDTQGTGTVDYTLVAGNAGSGTCTSASISVYYAPDETFVSSSPNPTAKGYYWSFGDLAPGGNSTVTLVTDRSAALPAGDSVDQVCLSADNGADACTYASPAPTTAPSAPTPTPAPAQTSTPTSTTPASTDPSQEQGLWDWDTPSTVSAAQMQAAVDDAAANGFNAIYLSIDDYLTIDALPSSTAKAAQLADYEGEVATFLSLAAQKNISVDAEAGKEDWAEPQNLWKSADIMTFVANYNATHAQKFRGVQYDVEPYLLSGYNDDEAKYLTQYVELVEGLVNQDKTVGLPLSLDVPSFYNDVIQWTPEVTVDGVTAYTYNQLLRLLGEVPQSTMLIMAYRNTAEGPDGTIDIAQPDVQEADGTGVKVIVGQETGDVPPSYVTFYGETTSQLFTQMGIVEQSFASDPSFTGMAVDYLEPFMALPGAITGSDASTSAPPSGGGASSSPAPAPSSAPTPSPAPTNSGGAGGGGGGGGGGAFPLAPAIAANNAAPAAASSTNALSLVSELRSLVVQFIALDDDRPLTIGSKGSDVWALQTYLEIDGAGPASRALAAVGPTGYFGRLTENALAEYQKSANVVPSAGYFGIKTRSSIIGNIAATPFSADPQEVATLPDAAHS